MENKYPTSTAAPATAPWRPSASRPLLLSRRCAELVLVATAFLTGAAARASAPEVELSREGHVFKVQASFEVQAAPAAAWSVLTDYDGMTRFVTSLRKSRVVSRAADEVVIEQEGVVRVAMFSRRIPITLKVVEKAPERIEFTSIANRQFDEYEGAWTVESSSGACTVSYELFAEMKPSVVPRAMARRILEKSIRSQLEQVQAEIVRRAAGSGR